MSVDFETEVSAALHDVADDLPPPPLDLVSVKRAGRRRRASTIAFAALTAAMALGAVAGVVRLVAPGSDRGQDAAARPGTAAVAAAAALTNVRAFYSGYQAAAKKGRDAVNTLVKARVASWYAPVLDAPAQASYSPVECGNVESAGLYYQRRGEVAGELVFVVGSPLWHSSHPTASEFNVVIADPATSRITGISCTVDAGSVPASGAKHAASVLYQSYLPARRRGTFVHPELAALLNGQQAPGSAYLHQAEYAATMGNIYYDPLVCAYSLPSSVTVSPVKTVADGSASLVKIIPNDGAPAFPAVVARGAGNSLMVEDVACSAPTIGWGTAQPASGPSIRPNIAQQ